MSIDIYCWLADTKPTDFDSISSIVDYFSDDNLSSMFGVYDRTQADLAMDETVRQWRESND